jgi:hypothetical protein
VRDPLQRQEPLARPRVVARAVVGGRHGGDQRRDGDPARHRGDRGAHPVQREDRADRRHRAARPEHDRAGRGDRRQGGGGGGPRARLDGGQLRLGVLAHVPLLEVAGAGRPL